MTTYLENYLASVDTLPSDLRRNFKQMKDLDDSTQKVTSEVEEVLKLYRTSKRRAVDYLTPERLDELQNKLQECIEWGEEKLKITGQTYEVVDKHIRRLDQDLKKFEAELHRERQQQAQQTQQVLKAKGKQKAPARSSRQPTANKSRQQTQSLVSPDEMDTMNDDPVTLKKKQRSRRNVAEQDTDSYDQNVGDGDSVLSDPSSQSFLDKTQESTMSVDTQADLQDMRGTGLPGSVPSDYEIPDIPEMPVDPNEPTYCFCKKVSYGQMIGCDAPDCPIEWFHFECVGLTENVKGKWYCPKCREKISNTNSH